MGKDDWFYMTVMVLIVNLVTKLLLWAGQRDVLCVSPDQGQSSVLPKSIHLLHIHEEARKNSEE